MKYIVQILKSSDNTYKLPNKENRNRTFNYSDFTFIIKISLTDSIISYLIENKFINYLLSIISAFSVYAIIFETPFQKVFDGFWQIKNFSRL